MFALMDRSLLDGLDHRHTTSPTMPHQHRSSLMDFGARQPLRLPYFELPNPLISQRAFIFSPMHHDSTPARTCKYCSPKMCQSNRQLSLNPSTKLHRRRINAALCHLFKHHDSWRPAGTLNACVVKRELQKLNKFRSLIFIPRLFFFLQHHH